MHWFASRGLAGSQVLTFAGHFFLLFKTFYTPIIYLFKIELPLNPQFPSQNQWFACILDLKLRFIHYLDTLILILKCHVFSGVSAIFRLFKSLNCQFFILFRYTNCVTWIRNEVSLIKKEWFQALLKSSGLFIVILFLQRAYHLHQEISLLLESRHVSSNYFNFWFFFIIIFFSGFL